jgi:hypothetical protein
MISTILVTTFGSLVSLMKTMWKLLPSRPHEFISLWASSGMMSYFAKVFAFSFSCDLNLWATDGYFV